MPNTPKIKLTKAGRARGPDHVDRAPVPRSERRGVGRPSTYEERVMISTACAAARFGATDQEIAAELGLGVSTLYLWYRQYPELLEAVRNAGEAANERVKRSLYSRANGYTYESEKVFSNGLRARVIERVEPDISAIQWWQKNRDRQNWRDTREIDLVVPDTSEDPETLDMRQLALATIALLNEATAEPVGRTTLDLEPNSTEETEDETGFDRQEQRSDGEDFEGEADGEAGAPDEEPDIDFDR